MSLLPENAFLPSKLRDSPERFGWMARRNSLFAQATAEEKKVLVDLAEWHGRQRLELIRKPNMFSQSALLLWNRKYFGWMYELKKGVPAPQPGLIVLAMGKVAKLLEWGDTRLAAWQRARFLRQLHRLVDARRRADVMLGVLYFLRSLRTSIEPDKKGALDKDQRDLMAACLNSGGTPARQLLDRLLALILLEKATGHSHQLGHRFNDLKGHVWRLLLWVAENDVEQAVNVIDEHWTRGPKRHEKALFSVYMNDSESGFRLALKLKEKRKLFAEEVLRESISAADRSIQKAPPEAREALQTFVDGSCKHLSEWVLSEEAREDFASVGWSIETLLRCGNPSDAYWHEILMEYRNLLQGPSGAAVHDRCSALTHLAYYAERGSPLRTEAMGLFRECVNDALREHVPQAWFMGSGLEFSFSVRILVPGPYWDGNRRFSCEPDLELLGILEECLDLHRQRLLLEMPAADIPLLVGYVISLNFDPMVQKYHDELLRVFNSYVQSFPVEAGEALKELIQYLGYTADEDNRSRRELCQSTFDVLVVELERISPPDAAVARTGIGWTPRGNI